MYNVEMVKRLQNIKKIEVNFRGSVGSIEGPWLVLDPMEVRSCVPRVLGMFFVAYCAKT